MSDMRFVRLAEKDMEELCLWYGDEELANRYGGADWPRKLWDILKQNGDRTCWMVWMMDEPIGYVDFEMHAKQQLAWIGLAVNPALRKQGWGKRILQEFLQTPPAQTFPEIRAGIEQDNIASVRCFSSVGFRPLAEEADEEGIVDYAYRH